MRGKSCPFRGAAAPLNLNLIETTDLWSEMRVKGKRVAMSLRGSEATEAISYGDEDGLRHSLQGRGINAID